MLVNILIYLLVFLPMAGAFVSYLTGRRTKQGRNYVVVGVAAIEFLFSLVLILARKEAEGIMTVIPEVCGRGLFFTVDGFRVIYAAIAAFMWMMTSILSMEYFSHYRNRNRYYLFWLLTLGATEAIFLSADLYTTFIFFEVMSIASYVWVAQDEKEGSLRAGATYLAVAVIGGLVMLMGLFLLYNQAGTLQIDKLYEACQGKNVYPAALCLLFGFGAKAGAFPLHIWLPKAHPVAPAPASALLSGILTKTGIFGVLVISSQILFHDEMWGAFMLLIGTVTMLLGAILAVFSIDFKRTLACSSISQIGFILVGVGMQGLLGEENALAVHGTFLHMMNHSLFKLVLFMTAGVIFMNLHKLDLNDIRGFGRKKPLLAAIYLMGALGIGGVPMWSGYISKTLLHESIVEYVHAIEGSHIAARFFTAGNMKCIEWIFLLSGGLTIAYMCKLFVAVFIEKNEDETVQAKYDAKTTYMTPASAAALGVSAVLIPVMGLLPHVMMDSLAEMSQSFMGLHHSGHEVSYFAWVNLKGSMISIAIGAFVYLYIVRKWMMKKLENGSTVYWNRWPEFADLENLLYRPILLKILPGICGFFCTILDRLVDVLTGYLIRIGSTMAGVLDVSVDGMVVLLRKTIYKDSPEEGELEEGNSLTYALGVFLDRAVGLFNKTVWKHKPHKQGFIHRMAVVYASLKENAAMIGRTLSYGLILFCIGLCATLLYLLFSAIL